MVAQRTQDIAMVHKLLVELGGEMYAVERIRDELARRGWTQRQLSDRTKKVRNGKGTIHQGVLSALLKPGSGRHLSIDQLITLAEVFGVPMAELLVPDDALANLRGWRLLIEAGDVQNEIRHLTHRYNEHVIDVRRMLLESPELLERVQEYRDELRARLVRELEDDRPGGPSADDYAASRLSRYPILLAVEDALSEGDES